MPNKRKKTGKEKQKKQRGENAKGKRRGGSKTFSKKNYLKILISAHARTSKAVKSGVRLVNKALHSFNSFWLDSDLKMARLASKGIFWQNFQESIG